MAVGNVGENNNQKIAFWNLENNEDAFRIKISLKGVNNCYVTPDNMHMGLMNRETLLIWNI